MPEPRRYRFVFITPCVVETFFVPVRKGAEDAAAALDVDVEFTGTAEVDIPAQVAMVRQAIADRVDGIALSICEPDAFNGVVEEALARGIPVIAFNIDDRSGGNPRLAGISQNFREAGRKVGGRLIAVLDRSKTVLLAKHSEGVTALEERAAGIQEVLHENGVRTRSIISGMFAEGARATIADQLASANFGAIVGTGQADTEGAGAAVEQLPSDRRIPVAGFDLSREILRLVRGGIILCTVDQQPYLQGWYPLVQLAHYARYGLMPSDLDAGAAIVDDGNVEETVELCAQGYR